MPDRVLNTPMKIIFVSYCKYAQKIQKFRFFAVLGMHIKQRKPSSFQDAMLFNSFMIFFPFYKDCFHFTFCNDCVYISQPNFNKPQFWTYTTYTLGYSTVKHDFISSLKFYRHTSPKGFLLTTKNGAIKVTFQKEHNI